MNRQHAKRSERKADERAFEMDFKALERFHSLSADIRETTQSKFHTNDDEARCVADALFYYAEPSAKPETLEYYYAEREQYWASANLVCAHERKNDAIRLFSIQTAYLIATFEHDYARRMGESMAASRGAR